MDLLSQAEHDESAQSILITTSQKLADLVEKEIEKILLILGRRDIAGPSWNNFGAIITVPSIEVAADLSNKIAPEHLELCVAKPKELLKKISNAGAILFERSAATSREGTVIIVPKLFQLGPAISRLPKIKSIFSISFSTKSASF